MKPNLIILASALILAAAIIGAQFVPHYQMIRPLGAVPTKDVYVWRLNTVSGAVEGCQILPAGGGPFADLDWQFDGFPLHCGPIKLENKKPHK